MFFKKIARFSFAASSLAFRSAYTHFDSNEKKTNYQYSLNAFEKSQIKTRSECGVKPTIIAIYDPNHGTNCADKGIKYLLHKGIKVITVTSIEGLNHSIFQSYDFNGIYLTGGLHISPEDVRTKFEDKLIQIALKKDIPLIGICRGLQTLGYHQNLK